MDKPEDLKLWESLHTAKSKKKYNTVTTPKFRAKFHSELVRILYYLVVGYAGPHPWGERARPPYPEFTPLEVKSDNGKKVRDAVAKVISNPTYTKLWNQFLIDLTKELEK
jgi:hypothetical protein